MHVCRSCDRVMDSESELTTALLLSLVALDALALMRSIQTRKARTMHVCMHRENAMARLLAYDDKEFKRRLLPFFLFYCNSIATTLTNTADSECGRISSITLSPKFVTNWNHKRNSQDNAPSILAGAG